MWIVDSNIIKDTRYENLPEIIESLGYGVQVIDYVPFLASSRFKIPEDRVTIFYGTINLRQWVKGKVSAIYCREDDLRYHVYRSKCPIAEEKWLNGLNITTVAGLKNMYEALGAGQDISAFIRPDSGLKSFTGTVINSRAELDEEIRVWEYMNKTTPSELVVISPAESIVGEFRFIICNGEIVGESRYQKNGKHVENTDIPDGAKTLAEEVCKAGWHPDTIFTCDICECRGGEFKIIEFNSFACAGWYAANPLNIVKSVTEVAVAEVEGLPDRERYHVQTFDYVEK